MGRFVNMDDCKRQLKAFIKSNLVSHKDERVFDEADFIGAVDRVVQFYHWSAIARRKTEHLDGAVLEDAAHI